MIAKPIIVERSSSPSGSSFPTHLSDLPPEIVEKVFLALPLTDRLKLLLTCSVLRDIHDNSARLQYDFTLQTSAYLNVPNHPSPLSPTVSSQTPCPATSSSSKPRALRSPHTGIPRPTIPSVTLAPYSHKAPPKSTRSEILSAQEKNKLLTDREKRWETLEAEHVRTFKIAGPAGVYELQEGMFLMCDEYPNKEVGRPISVRLIPLPSADDPDLDTPSIPTMSHKLSFSIADLTMDPTQDLIVVSQHRPAPSDPAHSAPTHRFHLLTLSTFQPHPLASLPTLDFPPFTQAIMQTRQLLQVMDDVLVVLVSRYAAGWILAGLGMHMGLGGMGNEEEIVAWNWKTGRVLARMSLPENGWFSSFALLTPTTLMITSTANVSPVMPTEPRSIAAVFPPVIQIYSFAPDPDWSVNPVQPLDSDFMDDTTTRPVLLAQLELPRFAPGVITGSFDVRPDPAYPPNRTPAGTRKPFTQNPEKGVLVFELLVIDPAEAPIGPQEEIGTKAYELFALRETLVDLAREGEDRLVSLRKGGSEQGHALWRVEKTFSWAEWGEQGARMLPIAMRQRNWVCSCSGYRFVSLIRSPLDPAPDPHDQQHELVHSSPRRCDIRVLDFSPVSVRRELSSARHDDDDEWSVSVETEPTVLPKRGIWKEDVWSRLPYREVVRRKAIRANGVMMDDQRLIVVCTHGRRNGDWSNIRQEMTVFCM